MSNFILIEQDAHLRECVHKWMQEPELAIDLEMEANLHHYGMHLSLVQVGTKEQIWVVDMLAIKDPTPIVTLFEQRNILKVFHDVSFDFKTLEEILNCRPKNVYDTKLAAQLIGSDTISLGGLLERYFNVKKQKKFQKADWMKRPLNMDMLAYASSDVRYLLSLKDKLLEEITSKQRKKWFLEECKHIEEVSFATPKRTYQDIKGSRSISQEERGRLKALFEQRELLAEKLDKPVFFIIPDKILLEIARRPPRRTDEWYKIKGIHPQVKKQSRRFYEAMKTSQPEEKERKKIRRMTSAQREYVNQIIEKRDAIASKLDIAGHLILSHDQAEQLATQEHAITEILRPWQKKILSL